MIRLKTPRREQTKPENSIFFRTKHDPAMFCESASRILAFARSRKHRCTPLLMMAVIFMLLRAFQRETYEDSEDLLILVFIVAHDGCHFYAAESLNFV